MTKVNKELWFAETWVKRGVSIDSVREYLIFHNNNVGKHHVFGKKLLAIMYQLRAKQTA